MKDPKTILASGWESFRKDVISPAAGPTQVNEMQKAFYGGAHVILATMLAIANLDIPDEAAAMILESMHQELQKFAAGLPDNGPGGPTKDHWH